MKTIPFKNKFITVGVAAALMMTGCTNHSSLLAAGKEEPKEERTDTVKAKTSVQVSLSDIKGHWGEQSIQQAIEAGYVDGYEDGTFRPEKEVTRAEFVKMLISSMKEKVDQSDSGNPWYAPYMLSAQTSGIVTEGDITEDLGQPISRLEMAKLAIRAVENSYRGNSEVKDAELIFESTKAGLITGVAPGELALDGVTTRAQAVTIIQRVLNALAGGTNEVDKHAASAAEIALYGANTRTLLQTATVPLPYEIPIGNGLRMKIKEIIVTDMTDPTSPLYEKYKGLSKLNRELIADDYVFTFHFDIINEVARENRNEGLLFLIDLDDFHVVRSEDNLLTVSLDQTGTTDGTLSFSRDKELSEGIISSHNYLHMRLYTKGTSGFVLTSKIE
ncbi:S-layer homology domain-containing protein [Paenibacillus sp. 32O-W]|uniref:S-layer homology domain-containing protein n=1 Tax=Paenibacillus sp. 32O-W TaxID=1695218 RepID=UPI0011A550B8|nr:S-layer homology domain-containing protein [Paenibacillus sp. 32O-W]